jgi:hypothetical protein
VASAHDIDPPDNLKSTNSTIEAFTFRRAMSWSNQDFEVFDNKTQSKVMRIETKVKNQFQVRFALELTLLPSQEKLGVIVNVSPQLISYQINKPASLQASPRKIAQRALNGLP